jgi:23S rRNA pseudouridine2605 synthase
MPQRTMARERLQKIIARAGLGSRRKAEELIAAGRVRVNGRVVSEPGTSADARQDRVEVDGQRLVAEDQIYLVLHKPRNVVSTMSDPEGRPTVAELVTAAGTRVFPVGRLDFASSGVLLLTNDGELSDALLRPRKAVPKIYVVKLNAIMADEQIERWREGVQLDDGRTLPTEVRLLRHDETGKTWVELTLREGRNQQIRRMAQAVGLMVMRLARISFAGITAEGLRPGEWRALTEDELRALQHEYGVPRRIRAPGPRPGDDPGRPRGPRTTARAAAHAAPQAAPRAAARAGRSGRPGTTPRGAARPASPARERGRR